MEQEQSMVTMTLEDYNRLVSDNRVLIKRYQEQKEAKEFAEKERDSLYLKEYAEAGQYFKCNAEVYAMLRNRDDEIISLTESLKYSKLAFRIMCGAFIILLIAYILK